VFTQIVDSNCFIPPGFAPELLFGVFATGTGSGIKGDVVVWSLWISIDSTTGLMTTAWYKDSVTFVQNYVTQPPPMTIPFPIAGSDPTPAGPLPAQQDATLSVPLTFPTNIVGPNLVWAGSFVEVLDTQVGNAFSINRIRLVSQDLYSRNGTHPAHVINWSGVGPGQELVCTATLHYAVVPRNFLSSVYTTPAFNSDTTPDANVAEAIQLASSPFTSKFWSQTWNLRQYEEESLHY
jgi:hypothetical protein